MDPSESSPAVELDARINALLDQRRAQGFDAPSGEVAERLAQLLAGGKRTAEAA